MKLPMGPSPAKAAPAAPKKATAPVTAPAK
jgi:hypothetical protein